MRDSENATTGFPSSNATWVGSAAPSVIFATADKRTERPSGRLMEKSRSAFTSATVPTVRITCWLPSSSALPPARSTWMRASCCDTSPAVTPKACKALASRSTRAWRSMPPTRLTTATPGTPYIALLTSRSTNQLSSSGGMLGATTA